jgi:hypothetical protein
MSLTVRPTGFASQVDKGPKGYAVFSGEWAVGRRAARSAGSRHARIHARLMANVPTSTTYTIGEDAPLTVRK